MWEVRRLGEIANIIAGGTPSTTSQEFWNGNIGWITPNDLSSYSKRYISKGQRNISELGLKSSSAKLLSKNTILLTTRAPIGYIAIAENEVCTNQGFKNLVCNKDIIDYRYMYYILKSNKTQLESFATGATFPELSASRLKKIKVTIPSLPTQQKIADILSTYDDLIENNNSRIVLLEQAAQQLYKEWFVRFRFPGYETAHFTKGIPNGWEVMKFGSITELVDGDRGINYPNQIELFDEGFCLFLNAGNVTINGFDFTKKTFITKEKDKKLRKGKLIRDDIVLTTRGTVGNVALYNTFVPFNDVRINSGMVIIRPVSFYSNSSFLYLLLRSNYVQQLITLFSSGSAQPQLPIKDMKNLKILVPSKELLIKFETIAKPILEIISNGIAKNQNLIKQRDLLLPRLMSGKLEV